MCAADVGGGPALRLSPARCSTFVGRFASRALGLSLVFVLLYFFVFDNVFYLQPSAVFVLVVLV